LRLCDFIVALVLSKPFDWQWKIAATIENKPSGAIYAGMKDNFDNLPEEISDSHRRSVWPGSKAQRHSRSTRQSGPHITSETRQRIRTRLRSSCVLQQPRPELTELQSACAEECFDPQAPISEDQIHYDPCI
jgi:hypothetical protein